MAPKKKGQRMTLGEFIETHGGSDSWADDDMGGMPLSGLGSNSTAVFGNSAAGVTGSRDSAPLPTAPPFTARIFNLNFEATESSVRQLFAVDNKLPVTSVRMPKEMDGRSRGFAFVEFDDVDALSRSLKLDGSNFNGRPLRISVAEQRGGDRGFDDDWRGRRGPMDPSGAGRGGPRGYGGRGGFEDENLDWSVRRAPVAPDNDRERPRFGGNRDGPPPSDRFGDRDSGSWGPGTGSGGFGSGPRGPPRRFEEDNLDWSVRREQPPPRKPRAPEPDFDWSSRREAPARAAPARDREASGPRRTNPDQQRDFGEWSRGTRAPTGPTPRAGRPAAPSAGLGSASAAPGSAADTPAKKPIENLQRGFAALSAEDDDDNDKAEDSDKPVSVAAPKAAPLADTIAAATETAAQIGDEESWTVTSGGKH